MKKVFRYMRSMRFGMLLLFPVLVCTLLGSVIPQGESESYYTATFPGAYHLILGLGLNKLFSGWVFIVLTVLFALNLTFCTVWQLQMVPGREASAIRRISEMEERESIPAGKAARLLTWLKRHGWRDGGGEGKLFLSPRAGWYSSVVTHFAILGVLLGAAGAFGLSKTADYPVMPGENDLPGGIHIRLDDFHTTDDAGRIDYVSTVEITAANGRSSGVRQIRVNKPLRLGANKYYQQSYGTAGKLTVTVKSTGEAYPLYMTEQGLITVGGQNGVWYDSVYPGYVEDAEGNISFIPYTTGDYPDPVYYCVVVQDGNMSPRLAFPGEAVETDDAEYLFEEPELYPSIRVKTTPVWVYVLLYSAFAALVLGLYLCFFTPAACILVDEDSYRLICRKSEMELKQKISLLLSEG